MSQKINPISVRLGILQLWNTSFITYGKNLKHYVRFLRNQFQIFVFLKRFSLNYNFLLENVNLRFTPFTIIVDMFVVNITSLNNVPNTNLLGKTIYNWLKVPVVINFYKKTSFTSSSFLVSNYGKYLVLQGISPKKLLQIIYKLFVDQYSTQFKLIQTAQGIRVSVLKGFKIKFSGCFEMSRNQMSKTIKCSFGSLSLTKLDGYVEYSNTPIYTKFGSCSLKIWLFYELKSL